MNIVKLTAASRYNMAASSAASRTRSVSEEVQLQHENQIFLELLSEDGLTIMARWEELQSSPRQNLRSLGNTFTTGSVSSFIPTCFLLPQRAGCRAGVSKVPEAVRWSSHARVSGEYVSGSWGERSNFNIHDLWSECLVMRQYVPHTCVFCTENYILCANHAHMACACS